MGFEIHLLLGQKARCMLDGSDDYGTMIQRVRKLHKHLAKPPRKMGARLYWYQCDELGWKYNQFPKTFVLENDAITIRDQVIYKLKELLDKYQSERLSPSEVFGRVRHVIGLLSKM